jgi:phenazine biosynthesis protein phzE
MKIAKTDPPLQGVQKRIDFFGRPEPCGFYNTFFAIKPDPLPAGVEVACEPDGKITALRGPHFAGFQFHVESVLTTNGVRILKDTLAALLAAQAAPAAAVTP